MANLVFQIGSQWSGVPTNDVVTVTALTAPRTVTEFMNYWCALSLTDGQLDGLMSGAIPATIPTYETFAGNRPMRLQGRFTEKLVTYILTRAVKTHAQAERIIGELSSNLNAGRISCNNAGAGYTFWGVISDAPDITINKGEAYHVITYKFTVSYSIPWVFSQETFRAGFNGSNAVLGQTLRYSGDNTAIVSNYTKKVGVPVLTNVTASTSVSLGFSVYLGNTSIATQICTVNSGNAQADSVILFTGGAYGGALIAKHVTNDTQVPILRPLAFGALQDYETGFTAFPVGTLIATGAYSGTLSGLTLAYAYVN